MGAKVEFIDYYAVLGVPKSATKEAIDSAYRRLARTYHPDVSKAKDAEEKFKQVNEAYEVLKDPAKRAHYDRYGAAWKEAERQGAPGPGFEGFRSGRGPAGFENVQFDFGNGGDLGGFSDFFQQLFGVESFGTEPGRPRRSGRRGTGGRQTRFRSGGFGDAARSTSAGADQEANLQLTLEEAAHGGRKEITLRDPRSGNARTLAVSLPKGVQPGQRIRLAGQGDPGDDRAPAGSLYLHVEIAPHPQLTLSGHDLHTVLPVAPWTAALGGDVHLRTLDGTVRVKVPPGSSSGRRIRLAGKGFPTPRGGAGDLYAEIRIAVPAHLSPEERELFEKLGSVSRFTPPAQHAKEAR